MDGISKLPETILVYILSFLSTEEAARTSILSKPWRLRWLFREEFNFDFTRLYKPQDFDFTILYKPQDFESKTQDKNLDVPVLRGRFFEWVNKVRQSHRLHGKESSKLNKVRLRFPLPLDNWYLRKIDEWVSYAFARKVRSLELDFLPYSCFKRPDGREYYNFPSRLVAGIETDSSFLGSSSLSGVQVSKEDIDCFLSKFRFLEQLKVRKSYALRDVEVVSLRMAEFKDPDLLSQLPEPILDHILSFLSTEEASRTSVISKYWRHRWLSGANEFDFNTSRLITPRVLGCSMRYIDVSVMSGLFFEWVTNVLESYIVAVEEEAIEIGLKKLRFQFPLRLDSWYKMKVDEWITYAFAKKVQSLELDLLFYSDPKCISNDGYYFPGRLVAETETDLSFLRSLSLVGVNVSNHDIGTLLERFRFLEHLKVCHSYALVCIDIGGSSSALKHLEIINPEMTSIKIRNTCLVSLAFNWAKFLVLENNPKLVSVRVTGFRSTDYFDFCRGNDVGAQLKILSSCLSRLQIQILNLNLNYNSTHGENLDQLPELNKLKELTLVVDPERKETPVRLATLLGLSPNLEKLVLEFVSPSVRKSHRLRVKKSLELHKLRFEFSLPLDNWYSRKMDEWVSYAFARKVRSLEMDLLPYSYSKHDYSPANYKFPGRLIPGTESFLTSLSLSGVEVSRADIDTFLLECRFLEQLKVCNSYHLLDVEIVGSALALKHLEIINCDRLTSVEVRNTSLVSLTLSSVTNLVLENNPKLRSVRVSEPAELPRKDNSYDYEEYNSDY